MHPRAVTIDRVFAAIDKAAAEIVDFTAALVRIPTVNPPGEAYEDCARFIGARLQRCGFDVSYVTAGALHGSQYHREIRPDQPSSSS